MPRTTRTSQPAEPPKVIGTVTRYIGTEHGYLHSEMTRATGRVYRIDLEALDVESLRTFQRLHQDLGVERTKAARRAAMEPWRGW